MDLSAGDFTFPKKEVDSRDIKKHCSDYQLKWNDLSKELEIEEKKINCLEEKRKALYKKILQLQEDLAEEKAQYRRDIDAMIERRSHIPFELQAIPSEASFDLIYDGKGNKVAT